MDVHSNEILGLIGPNGAGKTSLFNCITGYYRSSGGVIRLNDLNITRKPPYRISQLGIRRTFQNVRLFPELSVAANILAGAHALSQPHSAIVAKLRDLLTDLQLEPSILSQPVARLPFALQRRIELARALIADPVILLADEPGAGLSRDEKRLVVRLMRHFALERPMGIVLIEHDVGMVAQTCDRVIALDHGSVIASGTPDEIRSDPAVIAAYLGQ